MNELVGFHHVALTVRDLEASASWYRGLLGFEDLFHEESPERRACVMRAPGGCVVGLVQHPTDAYEPFDPRHGGLDHVGFAVASRDELLGWVQRLTDAAVAHSGLIDTPAGGVVNFKDPDGIALAFFWDRA
jgi:glyoxylase I family protein